MAVEFVTRLEPGATFTLVASTRHDAATGPLPLARALSRRVARDRDLVDRWKRAQPALARRAPDWIRQLVVAADAFIVERATPADPRGRSVIAGYPWFSDWGRDTMIALPGLAITTGRPEVARSVLSTFARFVDQGMLPNYFPDHGEVPEYNTVDAALWFFQAVRAYHDATGDTAFLAEIYPVLEDIGAWYERGTRHGIRVDRQDGLVRAGKPGVQLTWMDARVDDWVVTPRQGKPVEINALWYSALMTMARFAKLLGRPGEGCEAQAARVAESFQRYWNPDTGCLFDVLDGPHGHDPAIRPNQLFALSLPDSPLPAAERRRVLEVCGRHLLTSHGLRSLSPEDPAYHGVYSGDRRARDGAYHRGTVWGWLLPHYALAHARVHGDPAGASRLLEPLAALMGEMCAGTLPEIADGDAPYRPRGCFAQAWTVAETLRVWHLLEERRSKPKPRRRAAARVTAKPAGGKP
jgi:predicted glycogen debranching enzyme